MPGFRQSLNALRFCTLFLGGFLSLRAQDLFEISKQLELIHSVYKEIHLQYVDEPKPGALSKRAIDAMLSGLDPYSVLFTEEDIEEYRFITSGTYGGIGVSFQEIQGKTRITAVSENSPAHKAGIRVGDQLLVVNGIRLLHYNENVVALLRGSPGSTISIEVLPLGASQPVIHKLIRDEIKASTLSVVKLLPDSITGLIRLSSFTDRCADEVQMAFQQLKRRGAKQLILDLRDNPGGLLTEAVKLVNVFVPKNILVVYTQGRNPELSNTFKTPQTATDTLMPLIVWVNKQSASASEIVAGALQDLDRALIVGERSYGKGLVQQTKPLPYNSQIKLTVAKYYIPSGRCIQALDYSLNDAEGKVLSVADSLIRAFKTRNGRIVYDGAGILPDLVFNTPSSADMLLKFEAMPCFFEFCNRYFLNHPRIEPAEQFSLSPADMQLFKGMCTPGLDSLKTPLETQLSKNLAFSASGIVDSLSIINQINQLQSLIKIEKNKWLDRYESGIKNTLEESLVSRYYFEKGRIAYQLEHTQDLQTLLKLFADSNGFKARLKPVPGEQPKRPFSVNKRY